MYINSSKTKMYCILVFLNYHALTHLWLCAFSLWAFVLQELVQVPRILWLYSCTKLSHVVYAHHLHTSLLCYIQSRIPLGIHLLIPLSRWLGYPRSPRSPVTRSPWGPHHPLQRLSQETSVVDVTQILSSFITTCTRHHCNVYVETCAVLCRLDLTNIVNLRFVLLLIELKLSRIMRLVITHSLLLYMTHY